MSQQDNQPTFVVVTGNPQVGQGQRLSQIRSRNAIKHHERRIARYNGSHSVQKKQAHVMRGMQVAFERIPQELHTKFGPPPLASSPTGSTRMRKYNN
ncbi:uncharacterized protein N7483_007292 [Penicillium malachiteum]|uniref:uncharacterized protein n=1 Tax=Penicillium malachiteum TaxID=1324776 RepID=UPI002549526D|nr:uncharacterized protein N7483_007292 [Penicillium malachiteum]KAJ5725935.1 hypothetical protein N7483_007292 [Penicillium malachiteum]